ncbi:MAG: hypothetical protein JNL18_00605 [Planctomycetaceae bacterium]|nr:hypothetical protein [Planctomycetaceae bacterium]
MPFPQDGGELAVTLVTIICDLTLKKALLMSRCSLPFLCALACAAVIPDAALAVPYASRVTIGPPNALFAVEESAPTVSFILNEAADQLGYRINGGAMRWLDGTTSGAKSFPLTSLSDSFEIIAKKSETSGYTIPTGAIIPAHINGLSQPASAAGFNLVSDDNNLLTKFNSPRGVAVNANPNSPFFGVSYVVNSAAGSTSTGLRTLDDGVYALNSDGSDAFGYGDFAGNPNLLFSPASANSGYRVVVGGDGDVYVCDFSDVSGGVVRLSPELSMGNNLLGFPGGPAGGLSPDANHGSVSALYVEGSPYDGSLVLYTIDEDLTSSHFGGATADDRNSLWKYELGYEMDTSMIQPTKVNDSNVLIPLVSADFDRGADGKFYLSQLRNGAPQAGIFVLDENGALLYDSLTASRQLYNDPTIADVMRNVMGIAISPDQKWLAALLRNSDVAILPVVDGIPDLTSLMVVDTAPDVFSGRDVAFDAAGNLHYVSSGQQLYRVLSPGGTTFATTSWNGQSFSFNVSGVPEPRCWELVSATFITLGVWGQQLRRRPRV